MLVVRVPIVVLVRLGLPIRLERVVLVVLRVLRVLVVLVIALVVPVVRVRLLVLGSMRRVILC